MKKIYLCIFALIAAEKISAQSGSVGINTTTPHASAAMDVTSDTKGLLIPRLTTAAVNDLSATAAEGLVVYDKEQHKFFGWDGTKWQNLGYEEQNTAPYATNVNISGTSFVGSNLTGNYTYTDADSNPENGTTYSWKRADDNAGLNATVIASATTKNFTTTNAELGKYLQFCVVPKSNIGVSPGTQACSAWFGAIAPNTAPVANNVNISGQLVPGGLITGSYAYSDGEGDTQNTGISGSTFQWKIADDATGSNLINATGANNSGATAGTNKTYTIQTTEAGKYIQYCVKPVANTGTLNGAETCSSLSAITTTPLQTGIIASESFDSGAFSTGSGTFNFTGSGTTFVNGNGVAPASPKFVTGYGLQVNNTTGTITSSIIDASSYTNNITLSMRLASFSNTGTTNGADATDIVTISLDTGAGFVDEVSFNSGASNIRWDFNNTTALSSVYDGVAPAATLTGAASTITITNIPNTVKRIKISLLNNVAAEEWVIDDVKLTAQ